MNIRSCLTGKKFLPLIAAFGFGLPLVSLAGGGTLNVQRSAPYASEDSAPKAVKLDCELETRIPDYVRSYAKRDFDRIDLVESVSKHTRGKGLAMTIVGVRATPGGPWSGRKSLTVEGTLWDNGKVVGTFRGMRETRGGYNTCANLNYDARSIGKDVAKWLKSPSMDARLGDAR